MKLSDIAIRRPVFTIMMIGTLLVLGAFSYMELSVDLFPEVDFPFVVVQTVYPGAAAESVETEVTEKVEEAVNQVSGVRHIMGESRESFSLVVVEFDLEIDGTQAAQDVREKIAGIRSTLPDDIEDPFVSQFGHNDAPIISMVLSGKRSLRDITQLAKEKIKPRLEPVSGVGRIDVVGGFEREIRIALNPEKMEAYMITPEDIRSAIITANMDVPGGRVEEQSREYIVRMMGKLTSVDQFRDIIVKNKNGVPIYLSDVAEVRDTVAEQRSLTRYQGNSAVAVEVIKQSGANVVEMATRIQQVVKDLQSELPPDVRIEVVNDDSIWIQESIDEILLNIKIGTLLAVIVIFLFLLDSRPTFITGLSIPISIIASFTIMNFLGFTINFMTLLGLSLAVGILVDDAIVVIENIYRHLDDGKSPVEAAFAGTKEIGLAVIAASSSIMVVFLPVAFMDGIIGRFFYQFGMTVAFAVATSLFVAFSLTPMLSSRMFQSREERENRQKSNSRLSKVWDGFINVLRFWNRAFDAFKPVYSRMLAFSLSHRFVVVSVAVATFAVSIYLVRFVGTEFIPESDKGKLAISIQTPPGTDLNTTSDRITKIEEIVSALSEVTATYTTIGGTNRPVTQGKMLVLLTEVNERELSAKQLMDSVRILLAELPGIKYSVGAADNEGQKPIEISIRGDNLEKLASLAHRVEAIARKTPGCIDVDNTLQEGKPELQVTVGRQAADDLGLTIGAISSTVRALIEGEVVTRYKEGDEEYDVRMQLDEKFRSSATDVGRILVKSTKEPPGIPTLLIPVNRVASFSKETAIGKFLRYDRQKEVRVNANVLTGAFAGTVAQLILDSAATIDIPPGYIIAPVGTQEMMEESFSNILKALAMAIIFIYLLLASQYESFFDPFSIMVSLPLSLVGAILGLLLFGSSMSIMSMIGIVMLMGLVTKNAILLIDFVKQERAKGVARTEAILIAGPVRLRPILMTSLATVFGMLPLALGLGPGAEFRAGMARAVIGGMISSTMLTLIVVPIVYTVIDDMVGFFRKEKRKVQIETKDKALV